MKTHHIFFHLNSCFRSSARSPLKRARTSTGTTTSRPFLKPSSSSSGRPPARPGRRSCWAARKTRTCSATWGAKTPEIRRAAEPTSPIPTSSPSSSSAHSSFSIWWIFKQTFRLSINIICGIEILYIIVWTFFWWSFKMGSIGF